MNIYHQPVVATHIYDRGDCYIYRASISFHAPLPPQRTFAVLKAATPCRESRHADEHQ